MLVSLYRPWHERRRYTWQTFYLTFGGLCAGLGVITKGPYGILVPAFFAVFAPFRREDLKRPRFNWASFVLGFLTALAIWAVPAYLRDGGHYLRGVISQPDLDVSKGGNWKSVFWYVWYGIMLTFPYSLFLPLAIRDLRRRGYSAPLAIAGAIFIVISCIPKKRHHYLVPFYPFFALGIAASLVRYYETSRLVRRAQRKYLYLSRSSPSPCTLWPFNPLQNRIKIHRCFLRKKSSGSSNQNRRYTVYQVKKSWHG